MGGRKFLPINTFSDWDSNTICDLTGFKVKFSEVARRWDGFFMIPEAWNEREAQDFPVTPQKQIVFKNVRSEQVEADGAVAPPGIV